jgi:hypothetical protein
MNDQLWIHNLAVLYHKDKLIVFWPHESHTPIEKINAMCRFLIYFAIATSVYGKTFIPIFVIIISMLLIGFEYNRRKSTTTTEYVHDKLFPSDCSEPTKENPYVNRLIGELPAKLSPCNDGGVDGDKFLNEELPKNMWDIYNKNNSQRQFYTLPNNDLPNKQLEFANWLYGSDTTCKTNSETCNGLQGLTDFRL